MDSPTSNRRSRNFIFIGILFLLTALLIGTRYGSWFDDSSSPTSRESSTEATLPDATPEPPANPPQPVAPIPTEAKPETAGITFLEFVEQYSELRENFRARDSLTALVVDKHVQWEGYVRNVTRHATAFYVNVASSAQGYNGPSASITFEHEWEDELYALHPGDHVRFEGVVTRAAGSVGIDGLEIDVIEQAGQ